MFISCEVLFLCAEVMRKNFIIPGSIHSIDASSSASVLLSLAKLHFNQIPNLHFSNLLVGIGSCFLNLLHFVFSWNLNTETVNDVSFPTLNCVYWIK